MDRKVRFESATSSPRIKAVILPRGVECCYVCIDRRVNNVSAGGGGRDSFDLKRPVIEFEVVGCSLFRGVSSSRSGGCGLYVCYKSVFADIVVGKTEVSVQVIKID